MSLTIKTTTEAMSECLLSNNKFMTNDKNNVLFTYSDGVLFSYVDNNWNLFNPNELGSEYSNLLVGHKNLPIFMNILNYIGSK